MPEKLLLIGIDAMEKDLVLRWAEEGLLPSFERLLRDSSWAFVGNPPGLVSGGAWQSFSTGVSPARHGLYNAYEYFDSNSYGVDFYATGDPRFSPFWEVLSQAGKRVAVIDVPYSFLSAELSGIQVVDWFTHTRMTDGALLTVPAGLAAEIETRFGIDPLGLGRGSPCDRNPPRSRQELQAYRQMLIDRIEAKTAFCEELLARESWDLFLPAFCECHCVGHHCWHVHDERHPRHDKAVAADVGDPVRDVYVAIDRAVGRLVERAGPDMTVMVYSSFGVTAAYSGTHLLDEILLRLDGKRPNRVRHEVVDRLRQAWRRAPNQVRDLLRPLRQGPWEAIYQSSIVPNRATRRFFEVKANDATGGVRINLVGREAKGLVEPGEQYDRLCEELTENLLSFVNVDTARPLVREVVRTDRIYRGERLDRLPDLLVHWNRDAPILGIFSPKTGLIENRHLGIRTGDHTDTGLVFMSGSNVVPGRRNRDVAVTDLAPTVTAHLGVALATSDGSPIGVAVA